jgi:hypothetical protein
VYYSVSNGVILAFTGGKNFTLKIIYVATLCFARNNIKEMWPKKNTIQPIHIKPINSTVHGFTQNIYTVVIPLVKKALAFIEPQAPLLYS